MKSKLFWLFAGLAVALAILIAPLRLVALRLLLPLLFIVAGLWVARGLWASLPDENTEDEALLEMSRHLRSMKKETPCRKEPSRD